MDKELIHMIGVVLLFVLISLAVSVTFYGVMIELVIWGIDQIMREAHSLWH